PIALVACGGPCTRKRPAPCTGPCYPQWARSQIDVSTTPTPAAAKSRRPALSAYTIPRLPRAQELAIRGIALIAYAYGVYWITWRWWNTLNWDHPLFSLTLIIAETFGLISMAFFIFTAWRLVHREDEER